MGRVRGKAVLASLLCLGCVAGARAVEVPTAEWEHMKQQIADLQSKGGGAAPIASSMVDTDLEKKYGPNAEVTTKHGKLQIGLLTQLWYYNIEHDNRALFDDPNINGIKDNNSVQDGQGFRIRREELTFKMDLNENITSVLMIDPAREIGGYPQLPSNQGNIKRGNNIAPGVTGSSGTNSTGQAGFYQTGGLAATEPRLLQNAYITWHDCIPHTAVTIGQWKPQCGEEGPRDSAALDFCERSMLGFQFDSRAQGIGVDGYWWEMENPATGNETGSNATFSAMKSNYRIRYQFSAFNSDGSYFTPGDNQNRPNNNYSLDLEAMFMIRPVWDDCRGKLELGLAYMGGNKGKGDQSNDPVNTPTNDLNRPQAYAFHWNAWAKYDCGWIFSGLRGEVEWALIHDREAPNSVIDLLGTGGAAGADFSQNIGQPFSRQGMYGTLAYNFGKSKICGVPCWLKDVEVLGRYEQFQNIETADTLEPWKTDLFYTKVFTAGVNYEIIGKNARVQANYNWVTLPGDHSNSVRAFHDVHNNSFVINFQVAF